jgi:hypothetical protein
MNLVMAPQALAELHDAAMFYGLKASVDLSHLGVDSRIASSIGLLAMSFKSSLSPITSAALDIGRAETYKHARPS